MTIEEAKFMIEQGLSMREIMMWSALEVAVPYVFWLLVAWIVVPRLITIICKE